VQVVWFWSAHVVAMAMTSGTFLSEHSGCVNGRRILFAGTARKREQPGKDAQPVED
jgi:hypothetical protein